MSNKASQLILAAKRSRSKTLDLSDLNLAEIPPEVFELNWLEILILAGNPISSVEGVEGMESLRQLYLDDEQLLNIEGIENVILYDPFQDGFNET